MRKSIKGKKGFTLIELMIALVIAAIGLAAVTALLYSAWNDWWTSKGIKELQEDMDLASLTVKSMVEEANEFTIDDIVEDSVPETGRKIDVKYSEDENVVWEKEFYRDANGFLVMDDVKNGNTDVVIKTLDSIYFYESEDPDLNRTVNVEITVKKAGRTFQNRFLVRLRN